MELYEIPKWAMTDEMKYHSRYCKEVSTTENLYYKMLYKYCIFNIATELSLFHATEIINRNIDKNCAKWQ